MNFITRLSISTNWKGEIYDSILVIVDQLTKLVYYEPVKVTIDALALAKVIIKAIVQYHGSLDSIVSDWDSIVTIKFWFLLCYFLSIKQKLFTTFHLQTNG